MQSNRTRVGNGACIWTWTLGAAFARPKWSTLRGASTKPRGDGKLGIGIKLDAKTAPKLSRIT